MPRVKPFRGVRPPQSLVEEVESRPYDVLDSDEARVEAGNNEKSLYHIIKPEINFPEGTSEYDPRVYESGADQFKKFQQEGWLVQDNEENYYLYAQTMNGKTQYGIVLCCHVDDYMNNVIKKHELTRRDKEEDRMKHVRNTNANIEPVFLAYKSSQPLIDLIDRTAKETPVYDFVAPIDHFRHQFWVIADPKDKEVITTEFDKMDALYIADGHHRSAAAALVGAERAKQNPNNTGNEEYNFYMAVCFPAEQLTILDYNRVVKDLNGLTKDEFLKALGKNFIVEDMGTIHRMLDVVLVVLALKGFYILFEKPLIKTRLADIVEEARENNILCCLTVKLHPLGNNPREDRHAQRVVIDVAREMIDLIEVVNRSTAARERQQILLHHLIRLFHGNRTRLLCLLKDRLRRSDDILILLDEEIAAREDR